MKFEYCYCDAGVTKANEAFRHYVRLYKVENGKYILFDQGLVDKIQGWESQYSATMTTSNPYPEFD